MEHLTIKENKEFNGIELYFDTIPNRNIIESLKNQKFRWHSTKKCWFAKATDSNKDFVNALSKNGIEAQILTENSQKSYNSNTQKSELKYLLNGIKDKNGKYYACYYGFDYLTYEIEIHSKSYEDLPTPTDATGILYQDDTDITTDYFCKPSIYIKPSSKEYLTALENLKNLQSKNKNYSFTLTAETIATAEKLANNYFTNKEEAEKEYNKKVDENIKAKEKAEHDRMIEENKNEIARLQKEAETIKQGKYSFYSEIIETKNNITAISKQTTRSLTYHGLGEPKTEYFTRTINKSTYIQTTQRYNSKEKMNEYISNLA